MRAIQVDSFGGPEVLRPAERPPHYAGAHQVLVRMKCAGVNPVDTYIRAGKYASLPKLPYTPGMDGAGIVESVGAEVNRDDLKPGAQVWVCRSVTGTYAQLALFDPKRVMPLPQNVSFEQGAGVGVAYLTAWVALHEKARITPGMRVLVHGASGGVGIAAVQIARSAGCVVVGTAGSPEGESMVRHAGAHHTVLHVGDAYAKRLLDATGGQGFDIIIEMLANENLQRDLELVAAGGAIVIVGNRGQTTIDARATMQKDARILGMSLMNADDAAWRRACWGINEGLRCGVLNVQVREVFDLEHAASAHTLIMQPGAKGKIVLRIPD